MAGWMGTGGWSAAVPVIQTNSLGVGTAPPTGSGNVQINTSLGVGVAPSGTSGDVQASRVGVGTAPGTGDIVSIVNGHVRLSNDFGYRWDANTGWYGNAATSRIFAQTSAVTRFSIDSAGNSSFTGSVTSTSATGGIGYAAGSGGTVTQATSKSTGVTLNTVTGQVTMNAAALAASTTVSFVLTSSAIAVTDVLILNHISGGTAGSYTLNSQAAAGSATINVRNVSLASLSEAIVISFAVVKAVTA